MKILFITNICPHYHIKPFEELSNMFSVDFVFTSDGKEYHEGQNNFQKVNFKYEYILPSFSRPFKLVKLIVSRDYDIIIKCSSGGYLILFVFLVAKIAGKKFIFWSNIWHYGPVLRQKIAKLIHGILYRGSNVIVTYGDHIDDYIIRHFDKINRNKLFHSYNVIDNKIFSNPPPDYDIDIVRRKLNINKNDIVLLFVGREDPVKGLYYLFEALKKLKYKRGFKLIIVGGKASEVENEEIVYLSYQNQSNLKTLYYISDILVLPSITTDLSKETWGLVVNEAMNCGNAIIATDAVGAAVGGLLKDGITGYTVHEKDSRALENAIDKLLLNEELLKEMQTRNKEIIKMFDEKLFAKGFQEAVDYVFNN